MMANVSYPFHPSIFSQHHIKLKHVLRMFSVFCLKKMSRRDIKVKIIRVFLSCLLIFLFGNSFTNVERARCVGPGT
jgi:hypothetical protein